MAALHGLPLDARSTLPYVIRTGEPQFIPNREDYIRRWPHGAMMPYFDQLDSGYAISITSLSPGGDQPLGARLVTYDSEHHSSPDGRAFMGTLADLAGQALKRVRLQEARVELATALQQTMAPPRPGDRPLPTNPRRARHRRRLVRRLRHARRCHRPPWRSATPKGTTWTPPPELPAPGSRTWARRGASWQGRAARTAGSTATTASSLVTTRVEAEAAELAPDGRTCSATARTFKLCCRR